MNIERTRHIDADEPDADGMYDFYYEYDIYRFTEDNVTLIARSYTDTSNEARFLSIEVDGKSRLLENNDIKSPVLLKAIEHLRREGKTEFKWLSGSGNGYSRVSAAT